MEEERTVGRRRRPKKLQIKKMQHTTKSNKQLDNESTGELQGPQERGEKRGEAEAERKRKRAQSVVSFWGQAMLKPLAARLKCMQLQIETMSELAPLPLSLHVRRSPAPKTARTLVAALGARQTREVGSFVH